MKQYEQSNISEKNKKTNHQITEVENKTAYKHMEMLNLTSNREDEN